MEQRVIGEISPYPFFPKRGNVAIEAIKEIPPLAKGDLRGISCPTIRRFFTRSSAEGF